MFHLCGEANGWIDFNSSDELNSECQDSNENGLLWLWIDSINQWFLVGWQWGDTSSTATTKATITTTTDNNNQQTNNVARFI